ncbi:unnamed protein product [Discosporangium mesarthrocarpum]
MGLGKTAQTVSFLQRCLSPPAPAPGLPGARCLGPALVVVPLSTVSHWERELKEWTSLRTLTLTGDGVSREIIFRQEWWHEDPDSGERLTPQEHGCPLKFDVLVTTFGMLRAESGRVSREDWSVLVVDEAHRMKNSTSQVL